MLIASGVTVRFGKRTLFEDVNIKFNKGCCYGIIGANGAGKSTIVKLICGLYETTKGEILINGININQLNVRRYLDHIATLFQDFELFAYSIEENITFGKTETGLKSDEVFKALKIDKIIDKFPDRESTIISSDISQGVELSGGEKQKNCLRKSYV